MRQAIARMPKLKYSAGRYYIEFYYLNRSTGKMERYRDYSGFTFPTKKEKEEYGRTRIDYYKRKLKKGWTPLDNNDILFSDELPFEKREKVSAKYLAVSVISETCTKICNGTAHGSSRKLSSGSTKNYKRYARNLIDYISKYCVSDLSIFEVNEQIASNFLKSLTTGDKVWNEHKSFLQRLFNEIIACNRKMILQNPFSHIKKQKYSPKPTPFFRENMRLKLGEEISKRDPYLWIFIQILYYTALRPTAELRLMKIKYFDLEDGFIFVPAEISKNNKDQEIGMPKQLWELLLQMQLHKYNSEDYLFTLAGTPGTVPVGPNYFQKRFLKIRRQLGLPDNLKLYNWKHTAAANLIKAGVSLKDGQLHFRHYSIDMFAHYVSDMNITEAISIRDNYPNII